MTDPGPDIFDLALACYRAPLAYRDRLDSAAPLPRDMTRLLWLANGSPETVENAVRQTGAKADELRDAAGFLIQQLCFARGAGHYRVLGLEPGATSEHIKEHHRLLIRLFHPDRAGGESWTDHFASRVNEAWTALSRPQPRAAVDARRSQPSSRIVVPAAADPAEHPSEAPLRAPGRRRRKAGRSRPRFVVPRRWMPGLVLGGIALAAVLVVWGSYETRPPVATPTVLARSVPATEPEPIADPVDRSAITALLTTPDWQALGQRERHARQQASDSRATRKRLEQTHGERLVGDEVLLERMRVEQSRLEEQSRTEQTHAERTWSERLVADQVKLEQLKTEQARTERARSEQLRVEQAKPEALQAEQASAERLAAALRAEREQIEQTRPERLGATPTRQARPDPRSDQSADPRGESRLAAAPDAEALTIQELDGLIGRYANAYQRGDLDSLMALFAVDARGKGGSSRDGIRRDYGTLFGAHWIKRIWLHDLGWTREGDSASAVGRYELWLQRRDDGGLIELAGTIRFEVRKRDGRSSIVTIDYDWPGH